MTTIDRVTRLALAAAVALPVLLAGCLQGQGPVTTETRDVRAFTRLDIGSGIQVTVTIGPAGPLTVMAQENLMKAIATEVAGSTLAIEAADDFTSSEPVAVAITVPSLEAVSLSGGARVRVDGFDGDAFELAVKGGARATVTGSAGAVTLLADGGSTVELGDLRATTVELRVAGGATATVRAAALVSGTAAGGARVIVIGDADLDVRASGGAEVTQG
jgi:hypothetical protein